MLTEQYVQNKVQEWNKQQRAQYLSAYRMGDWDTVYAMTEDLHGCAYIRAQARHELAAEIGYAILGDGWQHHIL